MEYEAQARYLFDQLGLAEYYPEKLSLNDALRIQSETLGRDKCTDLKNLHLHIMQKIMAYHHQCRSNLYSQKQQKNFSSQQLVEGDYFSDMFNDDTKEDSVHIHKIHPMDSLLALLYCADDFLRQDLMARLVTCQLSIPLLLPDPFTGKLILPLWAMRSIVKEWKSTMKGSEGIHECPLISYATPIVAFVRFGRQEKSKSKIMNQIISDCNHDHFFHRDCEGGHFDRLLGEGLVELCWYLPAGRQSDLFPDAIMFVNLHGNAVNHHKQIAFLSRICFMAFVQLNENDLDEKSTHVVQSLSKAPGGVVLLLYAEPSSVGTILRHLNEFIPSNKIEGFKLLRKGADVVTRGIRLLINQKLKLCQTNAQALENCKELAHTFDIHVDEDKRDIIQGQRMAKTLLSLIAEQKLEAKTKMLPLQGEKLWQEWARMNKETQSLRDSCRSIEEYSDEKRKRMEKIHRMQLQEIDEMPHMLMTHFINFILNHTGDVRSYFLQCLKLSMDEISRTLLTKLQLEANKLNIDLSEREKAQDIKAIETLKKQRENVYKMIIKASLGVEHLLRETGQIYETSLQSPVKHRYRNLPQAAAELLIGGYPLELMDGDAAHIPEKWIQAVLLETVRILKNPKVFVLSIIGLQSTGKSSLLNTVFGLQFNVGAGRCTRGAYMQLLPISNSLQKEIRCEYMLVVDTEGLRAPGLDLREMTKHDNELAAFVIGLANLTLVNIYGEVPGDIENILQISIHAFLRMKNVNLHPCCQFIYQNVPAIAASDKGEMGCYRFKDKLDMMAILAAREEECSHIKSFDDVIKFDLIKNVHHFPSLWSRDPPMSRVNEGYSNEALSFKAHLIETLKLSPHLPMPNKLSVITEKVLNLWEALLNNSFVLNFHSTLDIKAYNELNAKFVQWEQNLISRMCQWENLQVEKIKEQESHNLKAFHKQLILTDLPQYLSSTSQEIDKEIGLFFEQSDQKRILVQWKKETENRFMRLQTQLRDSAKDVCEELLNSLCTFNEVKAKYQATLLQKANALLASMDKDKLTSSDEKNIIIKKIFDDQWQIWIHQINEAAVMNKISITESVQETLMEFFKSERSRIYLRLQHKSLEQWGTCLELEEEPSYEHINYERGAVRQLIDKFSGKPTLTYLQVQAAKSTAIDVCKSIDAYLKTKETFHPSFTLEVLSKVNEMITLHSSNQRGFTFTKDYKIVVSLTACGHAIRQFKMKIKDLTKRNNPKEEELRDELFQYFKDKCLQVPME